MTNTFDENMILERNDKTLLMFARDLKPMLTQCSSTDLDGSNWTPTEYTGILSGSSRFFLRRLKSGKVLLIHSDSNRSRANLTAELSEDDGKTWQYRIMLDPTSGTSYPDAVEAEDGRIFIVYDCGRMTFKEIRMAQITEADIIAGKLVDFSSYLNRIISKAPGNPDKEIYEKKKQEWSDWRNKRYFF